jgi:hypothetical protein
MATTRSDAVTQEQRIIIRSTYARILRQLHKDAEADALEKSQQMPEPTIDEQLPVPVASDNKATAATVSGAPTGAHAHALKKQADDSPVSVQDLTGAELNNALISVDQFFALTGLTPQSLAAMGGSIASSSASLVPTQAAAVAAVRAGVTLVPPSEVTTTASGLAYSRVTQTFSGTVTVMNIGSSAIIGPLQIVINGLPVTVTTMNATGKFAGTPYLTVPTTGLAPGQSVTASVQFSNPSNAAIELTPSIYSGSVQ